MGARARAVLPYLLPLIKRYLTAAKLRLTGRESFMHPLTYGTRMQLSHVALFGGQDGSVLTALVNQYVVFGIEASYVDSAAELVRYFVRLRG